MLTDKEKEQLKKLDKLCDDIAEQMNKDNIEKLWPLWKKAFKMWLKLHTK